MPKYVFDALSLQGAPLPYSEQQLEQGLMALEALLPGIQLNVNALPAAQYVSIWCLGKAKSLTLASSWN
jgi:hypothetical protein